MNRSIIYVAIVACMLIISCNSKEESRSVAPKSVKVEQVKDLASITRSYTGVVNASQSSKMAFKMGGLIQNTYVTVGSQIRKGQILMELDPHSTILDNNAKKVNLATQQEALNRAERLLAKSAISKQEYETTLATYESAKSAYEISKRDLEETKLYAPFSGFVLNKYVNQYDRVNAGQAVIEVANPNELEIAFTVPESNVIYFTKDTELFVEFDNYKGKFFRCELKELVSASPDGAGVPFTLSITDPNFSIDEYKVAIGFSCNVVAKIVDDLMENAYSIPVSAIVPASTTSDAYVMVFDKSTSTVKKVKVVFDSILLESDMVAVRGDIDSNDQVVVAGATLLTDGQQVKVLTK